MPSRAALVLGAALLAATLLGACGAGTPATPRTTGAPALSVVASFYPLAFAVERVGREHVRVTNLTKPGGEPHDLELSPHDVGRVSTADLVVYESGFQPSVDTAVDQEARRTALDVAPAARLDLAAPPTLGARAPGAPAAGGPATGAKDPHFWLDPQRYAAVATAIADRLAAIDPPNAGDYAANARAFGTQLAALDAELRAGTASCRVKDLVTSHAAFGYLSARYGFRQVPIAGLTPEAEPSAARLAQVASLVRAQGVTTIYSETLVEPAFAETVARSTGARLATLDPLEGITDLSAGRDYFEVMRSNLATLRAGQGCA